MHKTVHKDIAQIIESSWEVLSALEGKRVVISGGAGFLGSYFVATLLTLNRERFRKPCSVTVLDDFVTGTRKNMLMEVEKEPHFRLIEHDVRHPLPPLEADYVIHAAGLASPYYYQKWPLETIEVAVTGTKHFLEFSRKNKVEGMLYFSSSEVYGDPRPENIPTPETYWGHVSALGPRACYDESKRLGETLCTIYHQQHAVPVKIVRPFNVYGPGMKTDDYRVIPALMTRGLKGEPLLIHDNGEQTRTFCYITDAMQGFFRVLVRGASGDVYNVGSGDSEVSMAGLATIMNELLPKPVEISLIRYPESYPAGEPRRRCPDITKIKEDLGYRPTIDLRTGLARTRDWFQYLLEHEPSTRKHRARRRR